MPTRPCPNTAVGGASVPHRSEIHARAVRGALPEAGGAGLEDDRNLAALHTIMQRIRRHINGE